MNVTIGCKIHGAFKQTPNNHISNKTGCPSCSLTNNPGRYSEDLFHSSPEMKEVPAYLYFVKFSNKAEKFFKIGITINPVANRFYSNEYSGYTIEIISTIQSSLYDAFQKEQKLLEENRKYSYTPKQQFGGWTECFSEDISKLFPNV